MTLKTLKSNSDIKFLIVCTTGFTTHWFLYSDNSITSKHDTNSNIQSNLSNECRKIIITYNAVKNIEH